MRRRDDTGAAAVEFAVVAPLLLLLLFGILGYGYMLSFRQALSQGAVEAARAAVLEYDENLGGQDPESAIDDALRSYGLSCTSAGMTCDISTPQACAGGVTGTECVSVTVRYELGDHPLLPLPGLGLVQPDVLEYTATARTR